MVRDVEEVRGAEVLVAGVVAGLHRGHVDGDRDSAVARRLRHLDHPGQAGEPAADLGQHEVTADEGEFGVAGVDLPPAGRRELGSVRDPGDGRTALGLGHEILQLEKSVRTHVYYVRAHIRKCYAVGVTKGPASSGPAQA